MDKTLFIFYSLSKNQAGAINPLNCFRLLKFDCSKNRQIHLSSRFLPPYPDFFGENSFGNESPPRHLPVGRPDSQSGGPTASYNRVERDTAVSGEVVRRECHAKSAAPREGRASARPQRNARSALRCTAAQCTCVMAAGRDDWRLPTGRRDSRLSL